MLGALVDAIEAGEVGWDDMLAIRDELKSLPSGTFQDLADGTQLTVQEFAEAMIAVSDNTATDHLIDLLGRERVEAAQAGYGHSDPTLNQPFLTTREMFALKIAVSDADLATYIAAGPDTRRTILETEIASTNVSLSDALASVVPRAIEEIEWFASPTDLCRAMVALHAAGEERSRAPVRAILGANRGVPFYNNDWSYVGFKGGGEPGVLSLAWYLEGDAGAFVYVVNVTNSDVPLSDAQLVDVVTAGFDLLAGG